MLSRLAATAKIFLAILFYKDMVYILHLFYCRMDEKRPRLTLRKNTVELLTVTLFAPPAFMIYLRSFARGGAEPTTTTVLLLHDCEWRGRGRRSLSRQSNSKSTLCAPGAYCTGRRIHGLDLLFAVGADCSARTYWRKPNTTTDEQSCWRHRRSLAETVIR